MTEAPTSAMIVDGLREVQAEMGKLLSEPRFNRVQDAIDFLARSSAPQEPVVDDDAREAFHEALRRYPDAHGALVFFWTAAGFAVSLPTAQQIAWAENAIADRERKAR